LLVDHHERGDHDDRQPEGKPGSLAIPAAAGTFASLGGYRLGGAAGAAIGAGAVPYLTALLQRAGSECINDRIRRVETMAEEAGKGTTLPPDQLADLAGRSERTRHLSEAAIQAAADSFWPPTVRAIGRVYAAGLLASDEADVDLRQRALAAMTDLNRLDVILLDLLVRYEPPMVYDADTPAVPHILESCQPRFLDGGEPRKWVVGQRTWTAAQIAFARPQLQPDLVGAIATLVRHGLAAPNDNAPKALKQLNEDLMKLVSHQAQEIGDLTTVLQRPLRNKLPSGAIRVTAQAARSAVGRAELVADRAWRGSHRLLPGGRSRGRTGSRRRSQAIQLVRRPAGLGSRPVNGCCLLPSLGVICRRPGS
jgi:hypothetical protein